MIQNQNNEYQENIIQHYKDFWKAEDPSIFMFDKGPFDKLPHNFRVLEFQPRQNRTMWTYATCCMSQENDLEPMEIHIFSWDQDRSVIELLTALAYYHINTRRIGLSHTVNFGRPWKENSTCTYGLISLPYLDGPAFENYYLPRDDKLVKFFWLIPVTEDEVLYKRQFGVELLERKFGKGFNYIDPLRKSVV
jgi:hypothetical protein